MPRTIFPITAILVLAAFLVAPASAFTAKNLDIAVEQNGDATITFQYDLSLFETFAVYFRIADPAAELKSALEQNYHKTVDVIRTSPSETQLRVAKFATIPPGEGPLTIVTPALSFAEAEKLLKQYWFAPLISVDFSPDVTLVRFPDGFSARFENQVAIPQVTHTLAVTVP